MNANNYDFLKSLDLSDDVVNRVTLLLDRTKQGSDEVYQTPLGEHGDPEAIRKEWDTIFDKFSPDFYDELLELEESNRSKFGPRSIAIPWEDRIESVSSYFGDDKKTPPETVLPKTSRRLRPLSLANAIKYLKNSTNSGLPFYVKKGGVKTEVLAGFNDLLARKDPCLLFTRTQESKKTRAVWGFPIADTLNEMRYYRPVLDYQRTLSWRAAVIHPEEVDKRITELINYARDRKLSLVSIDFSAYDASLREGLQKAAFSYIKDLFQESEAANVDYIADRFLNIGLLTPDGVWDGPHGVPSGSTFTNEVDSICQYICAEQLGMDLEHFQIQGDDGAYATDDPDALKEGFTKFGLDVNSEKSHVSDQWLVYLQNLHSVNYPGKDGLFSGIYSTYRALNRLIFQERFDDFSEYDITGRDYYSIRTISILENCRNHPLFEEFVKFIHSKDKYGLQPTQEGIDKYVKMLTNKAGIEGIFTHQYGEELHGIRNFETVKLISKL